MKSLIVSLAQKAAIMFKYGAVAVALVGVIPTTAIAEPSIGTSGSQALSEAAAVIADNSFKKPKEVRMVVTVTAYNSLENQTDDTPCIPASGYNLCEANTENAVAANFLPLGAKIKIPALFGDRIFTVHDRTARKYGDRVDVWRKNYADAIAQGIRRVEIVVLEV